MSKIIFESENKLMNAFLSSEKYDYFINFELERKIKREIIAWNFIFEKKLTNYKIQFDHFFEIVNDYNNYWFGPIYRPNKRHVIKTDDKVINKFMKEILFSTHDYKRKINSCFTEYCIKGAKHGIITLFLYLSNPDKFNIWLPKTTEKGLIILNRLEKLPDSSWGENYQKFNEATNLFKKEYKLKSRSIDWVLFHIKKYVQITNDNLIVDNKMFELDEIDTSHGFEKYIKMNRIIFNETLINQYPILPEEEITDKTYFEGSTKNISVNVYERNPEARKKCIDHYGTKCFICGFDFTEKYDKVKVGYIHVHHLKQLAIIKKEYKIDPIKDLIPVCPNCHAVIHLNEPMFNIEEMKKMLK